MLSRHRLIRYLAIPFLAALSAQAQATTSLTVSASSGASQLTLDGEGTSTTRIIKIASLTMDTDGNGFTASVSSGTLTKTDGHTPVPFQVALVDEGSAPPPASAFTVPSGMNSSVATAVAGTIHKDLYVMYRSAPLQDPGFYSADIDVGVVDN